VGDVNETQQIFGALGYAFKMADHTAKVFAGYRYLYLDYEKTQRERELIVKGPLVGLGYARRQALNEPLTEIIQTKGSSNISLGLAVLGFVHIPPGPTEAVIALSILFLAVEVVHSRIGASLRQEHGEGRFGSQADIQRHSQLRPILRA
jgi:hypothetical protein